MSKRDRRASAAVFDGAAADGDACVGTGCASTFACPLAQPAASSATRTADDLRAISGSLLGTRRVTRCVRSHIAIVAYGQEELPGNGPPTRLLTRSDDGRRLTSREMLPLPVRTPP